MLHPGVGQDLIDRGPLGWVQSHKLSEEVLELVRVDVSALFSLGVCLPKDVGTVCRQKSVMRILGIGRCEGRTLSQDDEKNDCRCKQVDLGSLVGLGEMDLRCHVASSAELGVEEARVVSAFDRCSEAKICDLKIVIFVEDEVLGFQITMGVSFVVHEFESIEHLLEVVAGLGL